MASVELVIKISEEDYERCKKKFQMRINVMGDAIANGTPLPKGHNDLIDKKEITGFRELECNGHNVESLDEFTTIIEADKSYRPSIE